MAKVTTQNKIGVQQKISKGEKPEPAKGRPLVYKASIYTSPTAIPLDDDFTVVLQDLQVKLGKPVCMLLQSTGEFGQLDDRLFLRFFSKKDLLPKTPIALLIDSPGGSAEAAYKIARFLQTHCGGYTAIVPRYAKSAATLLALGADEILLGDYGELGPLDAQIIDPDREERKSALEEVQALERLHSFALESLDRSMVFGMIKSGKKIESLLPIMSRFVSDITRPLFESIDAVHYTQTSRVLKVAEDYAIRLLRNRYPDNEAERISRFLVENYPEHGFVIDIIEAKSIDDGLAQSVSKELQDLFDIMYTQLGTFTAVGSLEEIKDDGDHEKKLKEKKNSSS